MTLGHFGIFHVQINKLQLRNQFKRMNTERQRNSLNQDRTITSLRCLYRQNEIDILTRKQYIKTHVRTHIYTYIHWGGILKYQVMVYIYHQSIIRTMFLLCLYSVLGIQEDFTTKDKIFKINQKLLYFYNKYNYLVHSIYEIIIFTSVMAVFFFK